MKVCPVCGTMLMESRGMDRKTPLLTCNKCEWRGYFGFKNKKG